MKKLWILTVFTAGLAAGWLIRGHDIRAGQKLASAAPAATKSKRTTATTRTNGVDGGHWENISKHWYNVPDEERSRLLRSLSSEQRAAAIKSLFADAGPYGLDGEGATKMGGILKSWAEEDFDSAWAWSQQAGNDAKRRSFMGSLLNTLVDIDPQRALKLHLEQVALDPAFSSAVPFRLFDKMSLEGAGAMVDFIAKFPFTGPSSGRSLIFAENFDFRELADGVAALMKARGNKAPADFPSNFFVEWGKKDLDAAYEWMKSNPPLPFAKYENLLEAAGKPDPETTPGAWLARKLEARDEAHDSIIHLLANDRFTDQVPAIAAAMPDTAAADRFLNEVLAKDEYAYSKDRQGLVISALSSPEARAVALEWEKARHLLQFSDVGGEQLQAWGLTGPQIDRIFPPGK